MIYINKKDKLIIFCPGLITITLLLIPRLMQSINPMYGPNGKGLSFLLILLLCPIIIQGVLCAANETNILFALGASIFMTLGTYLILYGTSLLVYISLYFLGYITLWLLGFSMTSITQLMKLKLSSK